MIYVWIFNGARSPFPSGVFSTLDSAILWIRQYHLTGTLTRYPIDKGVYDWALENNTFTVRREHEATPEFIGRFSSAAQEHYHFQDGKSASERHADEATISADPV